MIKASDKIKQGASYSWTRADKYFPQYSGDNKDNQTIVLDVADEFDVYIDKETLIEMLKELEKE